MEAIIEVHELCKSYDAVTVLSHLNLSIYRGEIFGLLGANGAGKTTSIECMLGTKKADSGSVTILGLNPYTHRKKLFEHIGVQFQEGNYQDRITVEELCQETQALYQTHSDYHTLLKQFGLSEKLKQPVSELSGGQKQRLFIILALIPNPEIVFLDELTTGLDVKARRAVWRCFSQLKDNGLTVFLTSHFMDEVDALCDRIGILKEGLLIFNGTVQEAIDASPYDTLEEAYLWYTGEEEGKDEIF